jgi:NADPH2:quinone reductase
MKAIQVQETGGVEKLQYVDLPLPNPGPGQARVKIRAIGVNFIDTYHRRGWYKVPLPFTPGMEGAGVVDAVGEGVTSFRPGDRVAWALSMGSYAECATVNTSLLIRLPEGTDFLAGAAVMLQGMTAHYLAYSTFPLRSGETALVHAAAGGVGLLLTQIIKMIGARTIATVSTRQKAELAKSAGADHVILYEETDFEAEVKRITDGRGVDVVYDSVGKTTFEKGLNCLRPRGMMVLFGQSSGMVPPTDPGILASKGSLYLTRPALGHYTLDREELEWRASDVLGWVADGKLKLRIERTYPLNAAADAHRDLEGRQTTGKLLLVP